MLCGPVLSVHQLTQLIFNNHSIGLKYISCFICKCLVKTNKNVLVFVDLDLWAQNLLFQ